MFVLLWVSCQVYADVLKTAVAAVAASNCGYDKKCAVCPMSSIFPKSLLQSCAGEQQHGLQEAALKLFPLQPVILKAFQAKTKQWIDCILVFSVLMLITWSWFLEYFVYRFLLQNIFIISNNAKKKKNPVNRKICFVRIHSLTKIEQRIA